MGSYNVILRATAEHDVRKLGAPHIARIYAALKSLEENPYPHGIVNCAFLGSEGFCGYEWETTELSTRSMKHSNRCSSITYAFEMRARIRSCETELCVFDYTTTYEIQLLAASRTSIVTFWLQTQPQIKIRAQVGSNID